MIIDTNILIRYLTADNKELYEKSVTILEEIAQKKAPGLTSVMCLAEIVYVLRGVYKLKKADVLEGLNTIINIPNLEIIEISRSEIMRVIEIYNDYNIDFEDAYFMMLAEKQDDKLITFDEKLQATFQNYSLK